MLRTVSRILIYLWMKSGESCDPNAVFCVISLRGSLGTKDSLDKLCICNEERLPEFYHILGIPEHQSLRPRPFRKY